MKTHTVNYMVPGLRAMRKARGLNLGDVALCLEVTRGTVERWEEGLSAPRTKNLIALARLFHTTPNELLDFNEVETQPEPGARLLWRAK